MESDNKEIKTESGGETGSSNIRKRKLIVIIATATLAVMLSVFLGVYFGISSRPENKFARAQKAWDSDAAKASVDEVTILISIGEGEATLPIKVAIKGNRYFDGGKSSFTYNAVVDFIFQGSPITLIELEFKAEIDTFIRIRVNALEGILRKEFQNVDKIFPLSEAQKYSFDEASFYNMSEMSINSKGSYVIPGETSFDFILDQLAPVLESVTNMDLMSLIKDYISPGAVRGQITYAKGRFKEISGQQNISVYIPWEELDEKLENVNLPEGIRTILETRTVSVWILTINIEDAYCPTGLALNIKVDSKGTFTSKT